MIASWCKRVLLVSTTVAMASGLLLTAQDRGDTSPPPAGGSSRGVGVHGGPGQGNRPPKPPLELALDANGNGVIDADEIAGATAALKKLDKNGDGKLTPDEYRPPRPPRQDGQGPGGQGPAGGPAEEGPGRGQQLPEGPK